VIQAGGTDLRAIIPEADLPGVLLAYNQAITNVFVSLFLIKALQLLSLRTN
jgi:hypothetical protein